MSDADRFFELLEREGRAQGLTPKKVTRTGWNLFTARGGKIAVTANYAVKDERVSVKLTISRAEKGGPTPLFDTVRARFEGDSRTPGATWDEHRAKKESKVQVEHDMTTGTTAGHVRWALEQSRVMREWAEWARDQGS